jgi:hypothetical protein
MVAMDTEFQFQMICVFVCIWLPTAGTTGRSQFQALLLSAFIPKGENGAALKENCDDYQGRYIHDGQI